MADKLLLSIGQIVTFLALWRGKRFAETWEFSNDDGGLEKFREQLARFTDVPVYVMANAVEEDYRLESLPHASGRDRDEMVARRLRQHYRNTPYLAASWLGRENDKRRDDRYLFCALTNPELVNKWMLALTARGLPVAGLYLLPMITALLVDLLRIKASNLLLVTPIRGGSRLTYFRDGQFRMSRLSRNDVSRAENRTRYLSEEISNTRLYLHALRVMALDEPLSLLLIDWNDNMAETVDSLANENPNLEIRRLRRADLSALIGLPELLVTDWPQLMMHLQLLGLREPAANLAPATVTSGYKRYRTRRMIYAGCGAVATGAVLWTGANFYEMMALRGAADDAARQTSLLLTRYQEITRQFPQAPASAENLRKAVEVAQQLRQRGRDPERMMALVSRAMEVSPSIVLREFGWKYGPTEIAVESGASAVSGDRAPTPTAPASGAAQHKESALIEGEIRPFRGDYRSAIVTINGLAARLAEEPDVAEVRVVRLPLNVNPASPLAGSTSDNPEQNGNATANFKLLVILKPNA